MSTFGCALVIAALVCAGKTWGTPAVLVCYVGPYMFTNFWLVLYTWLQHTDPEIPHYGDDTWSFLRGALCTIDRPYTFFDWFHHHIGWNRCCG